MGPGAGACSGGGEVRCGEGGAKSKCIDEIEKSENKLMQQLGGVRWEINNIERECNSH